jgi:hypothetical protein
MLYVTGVIKGTSAMVTTDSHSDSKASGGWNYHPMTSRGPEAILHNFDILHGVLFNWKKKIKSLS